MTLAGNITNARKACRNGNGLLGRSKFVKQNLENGILQMQEN